MKSTVAILSYDILALAYCGRPNNRLASLILARWAVEVNSTLPQTSTRGMNHCTVVAEYPSTVINHPFPYFNPSAGKLSGSSHCDRPFGMTSKLRVTVLSPVLSSTMML